MVRIEQSGRVLLVTIDRPERRNAVDVPTAEELFDAFSAFDTDDALDVAILTGADGNFCAGFDLQAVAAGRTRDVSAENAFGPMGPTRMQLSKPVIAAVEGYAVAGGLELAIWCDMRVAGESATFGVFCRRFGVPLIDLGTIRLPRLIGQGFAADMILTGRAVGAREALAMGLANRVVADGTALPEAMKIAAQLSGFPQAALRGDRLSMLEQWGMETREAVANEVRHGLAALAEGAAGAARFARGAGRHGGEA
ncbi:MAG TPA: crotonase/enoyl-CoA hydratase family protein [Acetobacteraceae bacterium]|nr:crotonase/enoyl-CoA hydratase family protein [Acetobacteraceae bacterium]